MELQFASHLSGHAQNALAAVPFRKADVVLRHLQTHEAIASVLHLRDEIDLSVHAAAGPQFAALEKKETSAGWCSASSWTAS